MTLSILFYIIGAVVIILMIWVFTLHNRLKKLFAGTGAKNLEDLIVRLGSKVNELNHARTEMASHLKEVDKRLDNSIRNVETIRFNPFIDAGSNQSFAISFLNDKGDGVVLSSLYARDRMSIFAKPIKNGESSFELTEEEKEVLNKSK